MVEFLASGVGGVKRRWEAFLRKKKNFKIKSRKKAGESQHVGMQLWDDVSAVACFACLSHLVVVHRFVLCRALIDAAVGAVFRWVASVLFCSLNLRVLQVRSLKQRKWDLQVCRMVVGIQMLLELQNFLQHDLPQPQIP